MNYKYLGFILDQELLIKARIKTLVPTLLVKLGFFYKNRRRLDYGDVLYLSASSKCLQSLDSAFHSARRYVTGCRRLTHHCELYRNSNLPSPLACRYAHLLTPIYKFLLHLSPPYLCTLLHKTSSCYALRSCTTLILSVPRGRTEFGKRAFSFAAPSAWNTLQTILKISAVIPLGAFRSVLRDRPLDSACAFKF